MLRKRLLLILARSVCPRETVPDPNQLISVLYEPLTAVLDAFGEFMNKEFYRVQLLSVPAPDVRRNTSRATENKQGPKA